MAKDKHTAEDELAAANVETGFDLEALLKEGTLEELNQAVFNAALAGILDEREKAAKLVEALESIAGVADETIFDGWVTAIELRNDARKALAAYKGSTDGK